MNNKITKNEICENIFGRTGIEKQDVVKVFEEVFAEIKKSLSAGDVIELRGFGTFEPRLRKGREQARNPKTGEKVTVEPHYVAVFRAGQELKNNLWNLSVEK